MIIQALVFYVFAAVTIAAGLMVITARNPVHSVLFLILAFFNAAGLFVLMGAEFLAMILVVVYVGAVAVLFLFVVMMLDINVEKARQGFKKYLFIGGAVGLVLLVELVLILSSTVVSTDVSVVASVPIPSLDEVHNTRALGQVLYTKYVYLFEASGMILLVAMIGAIVLTLRKREGVRRQVIADQVNRSREEAVEIKKVSSGSGI
ncbi:NADH-quinone oxidoreductase subunit J [Kiloniella laminariae]|uniref:NADH-quinone oxidoreductase subunit J n=1 Tax=Kiloniella laminariae TaxID=454162 RepID=A0ABT4LLL5_9PROT|nr:NADH-quinone oxidoreductase subunit J [Kiloniella laminariae]MCZ4282007.1 NADH-quinone oxidoreductase subunit J [Kiloniella laminariae]